MTYHNMYARVYSNAKEANDMPLRAMASLTVDAVTGPGKWLRGCLQGLRVTSLCNKMKQRVSMRHSCCVLAPRVTVLSPGGFDHRLSSLGRTTRWNNMLEAYYLCLSCLLNVYFTT